MCASIVQRFLQISAVLSVFCDRGRVFKVGATPVVKEYDIWGSGNEIYRADINDNNRGNNFIFASRNPKVLNFFPIPVEEECLANDGRRKGICMNTYECRIQGGTSYGFCAMGFGVCCVFTATCDQDIYNNITYFVNPHFPDPDSNMTECKLKLRKIDEDISQIRLDFIHFNLAQPNRWTGDCEDDIFIMSGGSSSNLVVCGLNNGQHLYFDVDNVDESIEISVNLSSRIASRFWEVVVTQIPFSQRAPSGCLQYHTGKTGFIRTMNFAENGRHLANQDYNICIRQERGTCSIVYQPCDTNSFKIGPNTNGNGAVSLMQVVMGTPTNTNMTDEMMGDLMEEGSGDDDNVGVAQGRSNVEICMDKIVMPCDSEDFFMPGESPPEFCTIARCGNSLCPRGQNPCRIETSVTPFIIGVHFGPSARESSPDDNLGMCLIYQQLRCVE